MNKVFRLIIVSLLLISISSVIVFASDDTSYIFYYDDRDITIESATLNEEEAQMIADYIAYGITPSGPIEIENTINTPLLCIILGHSIETSTAIETIHNVYTTSPKCVRNKYSIEICTRDSCDYIQKTLIYSTGISFCHG